LRASPNRIGCERNHRDGVVGPEFSALFRSQTGQAPLNFQMQLRMAKARELLDTSELAIARIAEQCGYQDPYYFSRIFKKTHSISPARYRQQRNE
jgi:AraC family transcriptional regulator of arabinose operon